MIQNSWFLDNPLCNGRGTLPVIIVAKTYKASCALRYQTLQISTFPVCIYNKWNQGQSNSWWISSMISHQESIASWTKLGFPDWLKTLARPKSSSIWNTSGATLAQFLHPAHTRKENIKDEGYFKSEFR